jgi:hypothetical protein
MARAAEPVLPPTLQGMLEGQTTDQLKALLSLLPGGPPSGRKAELVAAILRRLEGRGLHELWNQLDQTQQQAVAETIYAPDGLFEPQRFRAKYGASPAFTQPNPASGYPRETPTRLRLLLYSVDRYSQAGGYVPGDLRTRLRAFVAKPAAMSLTSLDELPETYRREDRTHQWQPGDPGIRLITPGGAYRVPTKKTEVITTTVDIPLQCRATERDAQAEVMIVLRLVDQGKLAVSEKTLLPGAATLRALDQVMSHGDFYPAEAKSPELADPVGAIKPFAWPLLLQAGGLVELHGKKLALTKAGRDALGKPPAAVLRMLWNRWAKNRKFDEFNRVDAIKGQVGKGRASMTAASGRRTVIERALRQCPSGAWIGFKEFSRYLQASGSDFEITRAPWTLFIGQHDYGNLGYDGSSDWPILQQRYLAALLFEYAATLGLIDVAYVEPWAVQRDYRSLWGTDDLSFLSRYDGLRYFRINPLGAYGLGLTDDYQPARQAPDCTLRILPSLQITVASGALSVEESLSLELWAEPLGDGRWRLDQSRILEAVERGQPLAELRAFLAARDDQGLPDTVEGFLGQIEKQATALRIAGPVLLIDCADDELAELLANHKDTKALCAKAGNRQLAIKMDAEDRFRRAVRGLGYGLPKA